MPTEPAPAVQCSGCGAAIVEGDAQLEQRQPCGSCGCRSRIFNVEVRESAAARDGYGVKLKRGGRGRPVFESLSMPSPCVQLGKVVHHERVIDRESDRYFERVTVYETGEVLHENEEPLSAHTDHGYARSKRQR